MLVYTRDRFKGPLLFNVFINDILTDINSTIKLFADDTSLYLIVDDPQETAQTLKCFTYIAEDNSHFLTFIQRSTKFICDVQGLINGRISRIKTRLMGSN
jgi:hypothetical protein